MIVWLGGLRRETVVVEGGEKIKLTVGGSSPIRRDTDLVVVSKDYRGTEDVENEKLEVRVVIYQLEGFRVKISVFKISEVTFFLLGFRNLLQVSGDTKSVSIQKVGKWDEGDDNPIDMIYSKGV